MRRITRELAGMISNNLPWISRRNFMRDMSFLLIARAISSIGKNVKCRDSLRLAYIGNTASLNMSEAYQDLGLRTSERGFFAGDPNSKNYPYQPIDKFQPENHDVVFFGDHNPLKNTALLKNYIDAWGTDYSRGPIFIEIDRLANCFKKMYTDMRGPLRTCLNPHKLASLAVALYLSPPDGCFVEAGVFEGGTTVFMGLMQQYLGVERPIYALDTFEGMPHPVEKDYGGGFVYTSDFFRESSEKRVRRYYKSHGLDAIRIRRGLVQETLPKVFGECPNLSLMLLDTDQYSGTKAGIDQGFAHLQKNGMIVVDDTTVHGVDTAIKESLSENPSLIRYPISHNFDLLCRR